MEEKVMLQEDIIGLIPAAGKGMRLGLPYPKELYPVIRDNRYKPVSQFVVDNMIAATCVTSSSSSMRPSIN
ncbi:MAG: hypothetical protein R2851_07410 [Caldilineaceae bacterium]